MGKEEQLLECWRELPPEAQEQILNLAQSLQSNSSQMFIPQTELGKKLWAIRQRAIANGLKLLNQEELKQELADRRGGYRDV